MEEQNKQSIQEQVLTTIKSGEVQVRPRWHFVLKAVLGIVGLIFALVVVIYLISLTHFALIQSGAWFAPHFGMDGILLFLTSLPWLIITAAVVFIGVLEILVRKYAFAYQRPLVYSVLLITGVVLMGGGAVANTSLHKGLSMQAEKGALPVAARMYAHVSKTRVHNVHPGVITEILVDTGLRIRNHEGEILAVLIGKQTRVYTPTPLKVDDLIVVLGERKGNEIAANGIKKVDTRVKQRMHYRAEPGEVKGRMRVPTREIREKR